MHLSAKSMKSDKQIKLDVDQKEKIISKKLKTKDVRNLFLFYRFILLSFFKTLKTKWATTMLRRQILRACMK